jgi:hypothetical protein
MRNFSISVSMLLLATTALLSACGDDDDDGGGGSEGGMPSGGSSAGSEAGGGSRADAGSGAEAGGSGGEGGASPVPMQTFTVTVENVAAVKPFTSSGVFSMPVGDAAPGPATPGKMYEFTVNAGRKQKLSFVSMLAATNDLFYAPNGDGIALYDDNGDPISGFVTDQVYLWDAGTEVNEEPRVGANTVSKQAAPNTGPAENGDVVLVSETDDPFAYPDVAEVMTVNVTHLAGTEFRVTIENVSSNMALQTSEGDFAAPFSPGVWVVHGGSDPLFTVGMPDRGRGVENIAEDGDPAALAAFAADSDGITYPASPGAWVVHGEGTMPLFTEGAADYGDGIEHIAEDGNPMVLAENLSSLEGQLSSAIFNMPVGSDMPGPITPGAMYQFSFEAQPGQYLSFVTMLAATNDVFFGPGDTGIALFDADGVPLNGDITSEILLWDVGSEANEEPGIGPNTVTNQLAPDTGEAGEAEVQLLSDVGDGYSYPAVNEVLKVTISPE